MSQGDRGTLGLVDIATPDVTVSGVTDWRVSTGMNRLIEASGGHVDPTFVSVMSLSPTLGFTTRMLTALSSFGIGGAQITTLDAYIQKLLKYGTRGGANTHTKISIGTGMCVPRTLSANQGSIAELSLDAVAISADGAAAAMTVATGQSLPAGGGVTEAFTIGPVAINGTVIDVESVSIDFGIQLQLDSSGGQPFPTFVAVMNRRPEIRLTSKDFDTINTLYAAGVFGVAQGGTDSVVYFRKLAAGGTRVADVTAEHVKFTIDDGLISLDQSTVAQDQRGTCDVVISPIYDGANAIMVVSAASAIT